MVRFLQNLDDPLSIGPAMALGFTSLFLGMLVAFGFISPLVASLRRRLAEPEI